MKTIAIGLVLTIVAISPVFSQTTKADTNELETVELLSPWDFVGEKPTHNQSRYIRSCINLVTFAQGCRGGEMLSYGNRFGVNWDIFSISGPRDSQTRMVDVGKFDWTDNYEVPWVRPWKKLQPGEQRHITVNTSGADGADGLPGKNADGTYPAVTPRPKREGFGDKPVAQQASSTIKTDDGEEYASNYTPFMQIEKGHLYAVRVINAANDFYLLIHADDVVRGDKVVISLKKVDGPTRKPVF